MVGGPASCKTAKKNETKSLSTTRDWNVSALPETQYYKVYKVSAIEAADCSERLSKVLVRIWGKASGTLVIISLRVLLFASDNHWTASKHVDVQGLRFFVGLVVTATTEGDDSEMFPCMTVGSHRIFIHDPTVAAEGNLLPLISVERD